MPYGLGDGKAALALPPGLTREAAARLDFEAQRYDGIDAIGENGTVRCTDRTVRTMREVFGFDCHQHRVAGNG